MQAIMKVGGCHLMPEDRPEPHLPRLAKTRAFNYPTVLGCQYNIPPNKTVKHKGQMIDLEPTPV